MSPKSCYLFTEDFSLLPDVSTAVSVLGIDLRTASDTEEIKEWCLTSPPEAVLVYLSKGTVYQRAIELAADLKAHWDLRKIPLYALVTEEGRGVLDANRDLFNGFLTLPVEFPAFSRKLASYLGEGCKEEGEGFREESDGGQISLDKKLGDVACIFAKAFQELIRDKEFLKANLPSLYLGRAGEVFQSAFSRALSSCKNSERASSASLSGEEPEGEGRNCPNLAEDDTIKFTRSKREEKNIH